MGIYFWGIFFISGVYMGDIWWIFWIYLGDAYRGYLGDILVISGGCLGDIRGINEEMHVSEIWEIYRVISAWVVQPRGPLDQRVIFVKISTWTNIQIYLYQIYSSNVRLYSYNFVYMNWYLYDHSHWKLYKYINVFEYSNSFHTVTHSKTNIRLYSIRKIDTNKCPNKYFGPIYLNI